jgi:hypothetical protein
MAKRVPTFVTRLKFASAAAFEQMGGLKGSLVYIVLMFLFLGLLAGVVFEPFLRWVGHPPKDSQPLWFTILCAAGLPVVFLFALLIGRKKPS